MAISSRPRVASNIDSESVGCAWIVLVIAAISKSLDIANAPSWIKSLAWGPSIWTPRILLSSPANIFINPSVSPKDWALLFAPKVNLLAL